MLSLFDCLREFSFGSAVLRLMLALVCGGVVGYGRSKMDRSAGLRTYMLISVGAAMAVLISLYECRMFHTLWAPIVEEVGEKFDASRLASQTITGIGFLGAGIIIKIAHQQVQGLTTATGLFATVCMGIAAGAGFYELVIPVVIVIVLVLNVMAPLEITFKRKLRNITLNVEFNSVEDISLITRVMQEQHAKVYEIDVERSQRSGDKYPSAIFIVKLSKENHSHSGMLSSVAELSCVRAVHELIA